MRSMSAAAFPAGARESPVPNRGVHPDVGPAQGYPPQFRARLPLAPGAGFRWRPHFSALPQAREATSPPRGLSNRAGLPPVAAVAAGAAGEKDGFERTKALFEHGRERGGRAFHYVDGFDARLREVHLLHCAHLFRGSKAFFSQNFHRITSVGRPDGVAASHIPIQPAHGHVARQHGLVFFPPRATKARRPRENPALLPRGLGFLRAAPKRCGTGGGCLRGSGQAPPVASARTMAQSMKGNGAKVPAGRKTRAGLQKQRRGVGKGLPETPFAKGLRRCPATIQSHMPWAKPASASMPHSFFPPITRSLGPFDARRAERAKAPRPSKAPPQTRLRPPAPRARFPGRNSSENPQALAPGEIPSFLPAARARQFALPPPRRTSPRPSRA